MKNLLLLLAASTVLITSCKKDCSQWSENDGNDCVEMREKFIGTWSGIFTGTGQPVFGSPGSTYLLNNNDGENTLTMDGNINVVVTSSTAAEITLQNYNGGTIHGSIYCNGTNITIDMDAANGTNSGHIHFEGTK